MKKNLFATILAFIVFVDFCSAQLSRLQTVANWGESINGVQLSATLSNSIIASGSAMMLQCLVKNSSTNLIAWLAVNEAQGFSVILTNDIGKVYFLTPEPEKNNAEAAANFYALSMKLKAGKESASSVPIKIDRKIEPGNYQLIAKVYFHVVGMKPMREYELTSNLLQIQVK